MKEARKYVKRPLVIEAMQYLVNNQCEILAWIGRGSDYAGGDELAIDTLEGRMIVSPGDWVIKGVSGEFYPCKPNIFNDTYETAG